MEDIMKLCDVVRETGFAIHRYHKHGHLEKVYENALAHRLRKLGLEVKQQYPLKVYDEDGTLIGDYSADLFVDNRLIIELKAAKALADEHVAQILGYLRSSRVEHGLLINFGAPKFEIKKYALSRIGEGSRPAAVFNASSYQWNRPRKGARDAKRRRIPPMRPPGRLPSPIRLSACFLISNFGAPKFISRPCSTRDERR